MLATFLYSSVQMPICCWLSLELQNLARWILSHYSCWLIFYGSTWKVVKAVAEGGRCAASTGSAELGCWLELVEVQLTW